MPKKSSSRNDQRSNTLNPNNPAFKHTQDSRANQLNPNNPAFRSSRSLAGKKK
ncbi:MAG: hypothetical protein ACXADY_15150 [Candidatus Hodarchaeales archaeon]